MTTQFIDAPGDLFLGSDHASALAQGPRRFSTVAKAVRFAIEHAAPVSLRGAMLLVGDRRLGATQIKSLHRDLKVAN